MNINWQRSDKGYIRSRCGRFEIYPNYNGKVQAESYNLHDNHRHDTIVRLELSSQKEAKQIAEVIFSQSNASRHINVDGKAACGINVPQHKLHDHDSDCLGCNIWAIERLPSGPWEMYAQYDEERDIFIGVGGRLFSKYHRSDSDPIKVIVSIDKNGKYWGWQKYSHPEPHMIWPTEIQFSMCFGSGYKFLEKKKRGKAVRLTIELKDK